MGNTVKHRIKELLTDKNISVSSISEKISIPQRTLNNQINGDSATSLDTVLAIYGYFNDVSLNWLLTGEGKMYNPKDTQSKNTQNKPAPHPYVQKHEPPLMVREPKATYGRMDPSVYNLKTDYYNSQRQQIPLYELDSAAGLTNLFDSQVHQVPLDYISVPNAPKCDGAIYVRGDSMYPLLKSGDIVCYKTIQSLDNLFYGDIHLLDLDIEGDQHLTVKFVQKSEKGDDYISLISQNDHFAPRDVHKSQIRAIALVKLTIRYNSIS